MSFNTQYKKYLEEAKILQISEYLNIPIMHHAVEYLLINFDKLIDYSNDTKRFFI